MSRLFETHRIRKHKTLGGMWDFKMDGNDKEYHMPVPSCWEQHPDFMAHRGKGTYTKKVFVREDANIRLEFKGVSHTADVYWDGEKIAHHYNAFTPFSAVIKNVKRVSMKLRLRSTIPSVNIPHCTYQMITIHTVEITSR